MNISESAIDRVLALMTPIGLSSIHRYFVAFSARWDGEFELVGYVLLEFDRDRFSCEIHKPDLRIKFFHISTKRIELALAWILEIGNEYYECGVRHLNLLRFRGALMTRRCVSMQALDSACRR